MYHQLTLFIIERQAFQYTFITNLQDFYICDQYYIADMLMLEDSQTLDVLVHTASTVNPYSAGIDFSRQNLTTKVDPRAVRVKILLMAVDP